MSRISLVVFAWGVLAVALLLEGAISASEPGSKANRRVDFVRDVLPIFTEKCISCHGPDEQEGQLRLDAKAIVMKGGISGPSFVKGKGVQSLLYKRLVSKDNEERMPLDDDPLSEKDIALIQNWIDQGAVWPDGVGAKVTELAKHWAYIKPQRSAQPKVKNTAWAKNALDGFVLARLEKEGLSPSPPADPAKLIRRAYLDLIGLPPTVEQIDAFLADPSDKAYEKVIDTLLKSQHYGERWARPWLDAARYADSNGYQADQYRNVWPYRDWVIKAMNDDMPFDRFTVEQLAGDLLPKATLDQKIASGFHRLTTCNVEAGVDPEENRVNQLIDRVNTTATVWLGTSLECCQCHNHKYDPFTQRDYYQVFAYFNNTPLEVEGNGVTYNFYGPKMSLPLEKQKQARRAELKKQYGELKKKLDALTAKRTKLQPEWEKQITTKEKPQKKLPPNITKVLAVTPDKRKPKQRQQLLDYFLALDPAIKKLKPQTATAKKQLDAIQPITTLVMVELDKPRMNNIYKRGNFKTKGESVTAGTPRSLSTPSADLPASRLGFARWLVDSENPLTARVQVNRWWAELFGQGIVATIEDFGTQGELPTHPQLLDWLAMELIENGWSMKHLHKRIVMSATYQQSSKVTPPLLERDPNNLLLARGTRLRLPAETIRDNALTAAGLLSRKVGGPPVFPPQPAGIWRHVGRNAPKYNTDTGPDRFRRGIYVIWRRSAPYPSFVNFDAPDRASCVVKRSRTNTPLQALTLLNDPAYVEMTTALARRMASDHSEMTIDQKIEYGFRLCMSRKPKPSEAKHLLEVFQRELARFEKNPKIAQQLLGKTHGKAKPSELAAWFYVANILLNLDETITKG